MEDDTRNLLEESLKHLGQYRDACAEAGCPDLAGPVDRLIDEIELKLDSSPPTGNDPTVTISLVTKEGMFIPFRQLQRIIFTKAILLSSSGREASKALEVGKSTLYRHIRASGIKIPYNPKPDKM